jgi:hypothetical protein
MKRLVVLFNIITKNTIGIKEDGEPWKGGKEKSPMMIQ